jgi:hypothetical protein
MRYHEKPHDLWLGVIVDEGTHGHVRYVPFQGLGQEAPASSGGVSWIRPVVPAVAPTGQ